MSGYVPDGCAGGFTRSFEVFASLVAELEAPGGRTWTHSEVEDHLVKRSRELMRQLYQDRLDVQAAGEECRTDVVGADLVARTRVEQGHRRPLTTVFGSVTVTRKAYRAPGAANLHPLDRVLNLPERRRSDGLAKLAVIESARGSFDGAIEAIRRATGVTVGKPQLLSLVERAAVDVTDFYAARRPGPSPDSDPLVMTGDGKGIRMRPEALREGTRKAAAGNKLATRLSPGEKPGRKRMAELGAVYDITPAPRTATDVIKTPRADPPTGRRGPVARGRWLTASVTDDIPAVIAATFDEANRRDPRHTRTWIALVDGNAQQIAAIGDQAAQRGVSVTILIDFIHVLEYIWAAAWSFFEPGDPDAEAWVATPRVFVPGSGAGGQVGLGA